MVSANMDIGVVGTTTKNSVFPCGTGDRVLDQGSRETQAPIVIQPTTSLGSVTSYFRCWIANADGFQNFQCGLMNLLQVLWFKWLIGTTL